MADTKPTTPTRRRTLAAAAALAATPAAAVADGGDAEVRRLYDAIVGQQAAIEKCVAVEDAAMPATDPNAEKATAAAQDVQDDLIDELEKVRATTPAGVLRKLELVEKLDDLDGIWLADLVRSAMADLRAMAGRAA